MKKIIAAGFLAATFVAGAMELNAPAHAGNASHDYTTNMVEYGKTLPPIGHVTFCRARPQECRGGATQPQRMALTTERWHELDFINRAVNRQVRPATDAEIYATAEHWTYPARYGDCEDYVLLKRHMLMERGWPAESLLITVVIDRQGEGHAVLTVVTDWGDFVLDNVNDRLLAWDDTEYRFLKRQSRHHPAKWVALDRRDDRSPTRFFTSLN
ncbi:MAG: transglutaminase-like cysteine peptidase [Pseudomonadota bacterium]